MTGTTDGLQQVDLRIKDVRSRVGRVDYRAVLKFRKLAARRSHMCVATSLSTSLSLSALCFEPSLYTRSPGLMNPEPD